MPDTPSISTRQGDQGFTRLYSGEQVPKHDPRVQLCGELDELNCVLGLARCHCPQPDTAAELLALQRLLFVFGAEAATSPAQLGRLQQRLDAAALAWLETRCAALSARPRPAGFVVPGSNPPSAWLDLARSVARRCERSLVPLIHGGQLHNPHLLPWLNRLSDYLYLLARAAEERPTLL